MSQDKFLANMTKIDISPLPEHFSAMQPFFGGAAAFREVAYPISACVTVLEASGTGLMIIALDSGGVREASANLLRERLAPEIGIPPSHILLCASHSHSAPPFTLDPAYEAWTYWVMDKLCEAVPAAWEERRPARAGVGYGYKYGVSFNERLPQVDTRTKFVRDHVEGRTNPRPIDPRVGILRIDEASGDLMGVLVHFAAHPATLIDPPGVNPDFPGFVSQYVERRRPGARAAFLQGACGDINIDYMFTTLGAAEYTGSLLGKEVDRVLDDIPTSDRFPIRVLRKEHRLPLEDMPSEEEIAAWQEGCDEYLAHSEDDPTRLWVNDWNMTEYVSAETRTAMVQKLRNWCDWIREHREEIARVRDCPYELIAVRMGNLVALFHPFEAFVEVGLEVQRLSPRRHTWLVGYTNGGKAYLPTAEEYRRGGYEPNCRRYAQDLHDRPRNLAENAAAIFIQNALAGIREAWEGNTV